MLNNGTVLGSAGTISIRDENRECWRSQMAWFCKTTVRKNLIKRRFDPAYEHVKLNFTLELSIDYCDTKYIFLTNFFNVKVTMFLIKLLLWNDKKCYVNKNYYVVTTIILKLSQNVFILQRIFFYISYLETVLTNIQYICVSRCKLQRVQNFRSLQTKIV